MATPRPKTNGKKPQYPPSIAGQLDATRARIKDAQVQARDGFKNFLSGIGTSIDQSTQTLYQLNPLTDAQLETAYRGDWLSRKIVNIPAKDATREWREWQCDSDDIEKLETEEARLNIQLGLRDALIGARLYGGGALVMGVEDGLRPEEELNIEKVGIGQLQFVHAVTRREITAGTIITDLMNPYYGHPEYYEVTTQGGLANMRVHPSRVVRLIGASVPSIRNLQNGWGDSVLQAIDDSIKSAGITSASVAALVQQAKTDIIKVPELLSSLLSTESENALISRFTAIAAGQSILNTKILDGEEEWVQHQVNFTGLPDVVKLFLLIVCGAADIPATRLLGQSPVGLNATGESDIRNYYDGIRSEQQTTITPALTRLDEVLIRSALGRRDPEIWYDWVPLWTMSEAEEADIAVKKATVMTADVAAGLIDRDALRQGRENQLREDGTYPGLDSALDEREVDEEDPDVIAAFEALRGRDPNDPNAAPAPGATPGAASPPPGDPAAPGAPPTPDTPNIATTAMNGAQVTSLQGIIESVGNGDIPKEVGKALIETAFPFVSEELRNKLIDPIEVKEPQPIPAALARNAAMAADPNQPNPSDPDADPASGPEGERRPPRRSPPQLRVVGGDGIVRRGPWTDAEPRSLYVHRPLLNGDEVRRWAKAQGFETTLPASDMHVTVAFSRTPVDWMKAGEAWDSPGDDGTLTIRPGGPRLVEKLGRAVVLLFASSSLSYRHMMLRDMGASWDWDEYQPHITITYRPPDGLDLRNLQPYTGKLEFGPELFQEVNDDWAKEITEDGPRKVRKPRETRL